MFLPAYVAFEPSSSSIRKSWLYLQTRSVRQGAPVLIWPLFRATTKSAIVASSVSPLRCETIAVIPARCAMLIALIVSVSVPIWFSLIKIELATPLSIPFCNLSVLVTNKSSPTSWIFLPKAWVSLPQFSQSSSARPSSIERIGYFLIRSL